MIIKCKMCGGDIRFNPGETYGQCDHCGCTSTIPKVSDEQLTNLFNRANHFRRQCEFDKAVSAYEHILEEDNANAEAHWGVVLSKFGIEYVEDPVTHERIPTCHRAQVESILADADYQDALRYAADATTRDLYEKEAKRIAEIQKGILAISSQEKPYDVFICYKETDDGGSRTKDSALAQEIYYELVNAGYKVFFSRITLEDKLGREYEPYIFAALNSAKVMLVIGTKPENFRAVWVKNEWSRYLALMKTDRKRLLIPCYRDMDPYDLPEELSSLQSQDMGKIGFIQDLIRGVKKVIGGEKKEPAASAQTAGPGISSLYRRAVLFLEDSDWEAADEYFDRILDMDPEYAPAYIGKVQVENKVRKEADLARCREPLSQNANYQKALRFAGEQQKAVYSGYNRAIQERLDLEKKEAAYREADALERRAAVEKDFLKAAQMYESAGGIRDARERAANCRVKAGAARDEAEKQAARYKEQMERERKEREKQEEAHRIEEEKRREAEAERRRREEALRQAKKKRTTRIGAVIAAAVLLIFGGFMVYNKIIVPKGKYDQAMALLNEGKLDEAYGAFAELADYSDSKTRLQEIQYKKAMALLKEGKLDEAYGAFTELADYSDSKTRLREIRYKKAAALLSEGKLDEAREVLLMAVGYEDAAAMIEKIDRYAAAEADERDGKLVSAMQSFRELGDFHDAAARAEALAAQVYDQASGLLEKKDYEAAVGLLTQLGDYADSAEKIKAAQETMYQEAAAKMAAGDVAGAYEAFGKIGEYSDSGAVRRKIEEDYAAAVKLLEEGKFTEAKTAFEALRNYGDSETQVKECVYRRADALRNEGKFDEAVSLYTALEDYRDSRDQIGITLYRKAEAQLANGEIDSAIRTFEGIADVGDSLERARKIRYDRAMSLWKEGSLQEAMAELEALGDYSDAREQLKALSTDIAEKAMAEKNYAAALSAYRYMEQTEEVRAKEYALAQICYEEGHYEEATAAYEMLGQYELSLSRLPVARYAWADQLFKSGEFEKAAEQFDLLGDMTDSAERARESRYQWGLKQMEAGEYEQAKTVFALIADYRDAADQGKECDYRIAAGLLEAGKPEEAQKIFSALGSYSDSETRTSECVYHRAEALLAEGKYASAQELYASVDYQDSAEKAKECAYREGDRLYQEKQYAEAESWFAGVQDYLDGAERAKDSRLQQGKALMEAEDYQGALACLETLEYGDSAALADRCHYELGHREHISGKMDGAVAQYAYALPMAEAGEALMEAARDYASINETLKSVQTLWLIRDQETAQAMLKEIGTLKEQTGEGETALLAWLAAGESTHAEAVRAASGESLEAFDQVLSSCNLLPEDLNFRKAMKYQYGMAARENGRWDEAVTAFTAAGDYSDAATQIQETRYQEAAALEAAGDQENAYLLFMSIMDYGDSFERANKPYYDLGIQKREAGEWDEAVAAFTHAGMYSDAVTQIQETRYQEGKAKQSAQDWDGAVAAFKAAGDYSDAATQILETRYQQAKNHYDSGNYAEAYKVYKQIAGYSNVDSLLSTDDHLLAAAAAAREAKLAPYKTVGSIVTFGQYEQDNNTGNGKEAIEWIVLDVQDGKSLLLSRYGLDAKPYNAEWKSITWEECSLRAWLNNDFLKSAFTQEEQSAILLTTVDNSQSQGYSKWKANGGNNTQDYLFLLSYAEAKKYLGVTDRDRNNTKSRVVPTAYAKAQRAWTSGKNKTADGEAAGWWWLRSPGHLQDYAVNVSDDGSFLSGSVGHGHDVVRPAFWLNLESDIF